jgi:hypothetical protein
MALSPNVLGSVAAWQGAPYWSHSPFNGNWLCHATHTATTAPECGSVAFWSLPATVPRSGMSPGQRKQSP